MKFDEQLWLSYQYSVLVSCVRHLAYYRVLFDTFVGSRATSDFWTRTITAHALTATIQWCKVFGVDSNDTHWKKAVLESEDQIAFKKELLRATSMTEEQWIAYWNEMKNFRNKYAAHRLASSNLPVVPHFNPALLSAIACDEWVRATFLRGVPGMELREEHQDATRAATDLAERLQEHGFFDMG